MNVVQIVDYLRLQRFSKLFVSLAQRLLGLGMTAEESVRTRERRDHFNTFNHCKADGSALTMFQIQLLVQAVPWY